MVEPCDSVAGVAPCFLSGGSPPKGRVNQCLRGKAQYRSMKHVAPSLRDGERSKISAICESRRDSPTRKSTSLVGIGAKPDPFAWPSLKGWEPSEGLPERTNGPAVCRSQGISDMARTPNCWAVGPLLDASTTNPALLAGLCKLLGLWPDFTRQMFCGQ